MTSIPMSRTSITYFIVLVLCSYVVYRTPNQFTLVNGVLLYISIFIVNYALSLFLGYGFLWKHHDLVKLCYIAESNFCGEHHAKPGLNLSENVFNTTVNSDDDNVDIVDISMENAQKNKFDFILSQCNLSENDWLLDIGCGHGTFLQYAKSHKINCCGLNLSKSQADEVKQRFNICVLNCAYTDIINDPAKYSKYYNKFDTITFIGSTDHLCSPFKKLHKNEVDLSFKNIFKIAIILLKPTGKLFISGMHTIYEKPWSLLGNLNAFILEHTMSGYFPDATKNQLINCAKPYGFNVDHISNKTEEYRITALKATNSWQSCSLSFHLLHLFKYPITIYYLLQHLLFDPAFFMRIIGIYTDSWMWFYGQDCYSTKYDPKFRAKETFIQLKWIAFSLHKST